MLRRPKLLLADEPTGNLDAENSGILLDSLKEFSAEGGAVLMVTHDERAREAAGRSIGMKAGEIVDPA
jgi:ABC-type lipoprotein export system ATPase subunit